MPYEKTSDLKILEKGDHTVLFTNGMMRFNGRLSYCHAVNGQVEKDDDGKDKKRVWPCGLLIPKAWDDAKVLAVRRMKDQMTDAKLDALSPELKWFRDGDKKTIKETGKKDPITAGHWIVSARAYNPVVLYGPRTDPKTGKVEVLEASPDALKLFYSGANGALMLNPWYKPPSDPKRLKRLSAELLSVQFLKHGDPISGNRLSADKMGAGFDTTDTGGFDDDDDDDLDLEDDDGL